RPILYVINTHYHGDHTFGNQHFKEAREIIAHRNTKDNLIEKKEEHMKTFIRFFGKERAKGVTLTPPTTTIEKGLSLAVGEERIEIEFIGKGHTDGDVVVYLPKKGVLFAGDLLYKDRLPWVGDGDTYTWLEALKKLSLYDASIFVPGHGGIGDKSIVNLFMSYLEDLHREVNRLKQMGLSLKRVKEEIRLPGYQDYKKYKEWLSLNAEKVYRELDERSQ
ncbi:MAG: MBL fold metallo-hydrolase, partial [Thermodesulfobacteriota bacterium]